MFLFSLIIEAFIPETPTKFDWVTIVIVCGWLAMLLTGRIPEEITGWMLWLIYVTLIYGFIDSSINIVFGKSEEND